jgi:ATP/maltotriose-dependent transcriptional regulator MalT
VGDEVERGRAAFARRAWGEASALLAAAAPSDVDDLERLAVAAQLAGHTDESEQAWARAHLECARLGDADRAVRCAFWLGFALLLRGDVAQAGGWLGRAARMAEQAGPVGAGHGFLLVPAFLEAVGGGDHARAGALAAEAVEIAQRFADPDLLALGLLCGGEARLAAREVGPGLRFLDEAMLSVTTADVSPVTAGIVYCAVIEACLHAFEVRRAAEWTEALSRWCAAQPQMVAYRGQCLVHRSQILQARGDWAEAVTEAEQARRRLSEPPHPALGLALYQQGELHRLRGDLADAERAYRAASEQGFEPAPGFALLRLAQGNVRSAVVAVRRMVEESRGGLRHPVMLAAAVEVLLATGEVDGARSACAELAGLARTSDTLLLGAEADYAAGSVLLAEGEATAALAALRRACATWRELEMPFETARTRLQVALAYRALGDDDGAALELDAARATFERLGARPHLARVAQLAAPLPREPGALTAREREVLRLVATGRTNREIAAELVISEHTVARHLQNIFGKLDLPSRAAATAYAYEHGLV